MLYATVSGTDNIGSAKLELVRLALVCLSVYLYRPCHVSYERYGVRS